MCVLGSFLLAPATKLQQQWMENRETNGPQNFENEMRNLVSSAMEGVGHKQPEGRNRQSSNAGGNSGGSSADASGSTSGVQQYGNMQVVT